MARSRHDIPKNLRTILHFNSNEQTTSKVRGHSAEENSALA
jgi:hypothetical protein